MKNFIFYLKNCICIDEELQIFLYMNNCIFYTWIIIGKSSQNSPTLVLIWDGVVGLYRVYFFYVFTLLKVVSHYALIILSISVMGFQINKLWIGSGWVGWSLYMFWVFVLNFANPLISSRRLPTRTLSVLSDMSFASSSGLILGKSLVPASSAKLSRISRSIFATRSCHPAISDTL